MKSPIWTPAACPRIRATARALAAVTLAAACAAPAAGNTPSAQGAGASASAAAMVAAAPVLAPCRLKGVASEAVCGVIKRPLDPARPDGPQIDLHYAVVPALARNKRADPVFFLAGGPGQSAIEVAGAMSQRLARFSNRRDLVFVDQRGTGRSAPLKCPHDDPRLIIQPLAEAVDPAVMVGRMAACRAALEQLPHGDLRMYTTTIAMADLDAVRATLGAERINLIGASYGTRAALEYMRRFPQRLRRVVIDGVAPPDMVLPRSFSADTQAAFDALLGWCEADARCHQQHPALRADWQALLKRLPVTTEATHPVTGQVERVTLGADLITGMVRSPLYAPALAAGLPAAISAAAQGRFGPLMGLSLALTAAGDGIASGMHFSVLCAEDAPRMAASTEALGHDFGDSFTRQYVSVCQHWPRGAVPADFYTIAAAPVATLVLSGGLDPATPPRHGVRVTQALGAKARHVLVAHAGHGTLGSPCMRDQVFRFIDAASDDEALKPALDCTDGVPRPPLFVPVAQRASGATR